MIEWIIFSQESQRRSNHKRNNWTAQLTNFYRFNVRTSDTIKGHYSVFIVWSCTRTQLLTIKCVHVSAHTKLHLKKLRKKLYKNICMRFGATASYEATHSVGYTLPLLHCSFISIFVFFSVCVALPSPSHIYYFCVQKFSFHRKCAHGLAHHRRTNCTCLRLNANTHQIHGNEFIFRI